MMILFETSTTGMPREIDSTWLTRLQLVSAFHEDLLALSSFKRTTIVSLPDIQAETEPSGTCRSISIGRNGEVGEGICRHLRHVSATQECKNKSWSPSTPTCTGKTMENDQHGLYHGPAKNSTTPRRCVYHCGQKMTNMSMWFQQHQPLMQKVLLLFTSTMFSRCMAWVSPLFQIEIPASRLPSLTL